MYIVDDIAYANEIVDGIKVTAARVAEDRVALVTFSTGETRLFDATVLLDKPAFASLADQDVFADFSIERGVMCWQDGSIDIAPSRMYELSYAYDNVA